MIDLLLKNATLPDGSSKIDIAVDAGFILDRGTALKYDCRQQMDLGGRLLIPGFVESHLHLDIALMNSNDLPGRQEPFRSLPGLNESMERRRKAFSQKDLRHRAGKALEMASRHGVTALRAQCHVDTEVGLSHLEALLWAKNKYSDRITVQIVAFPQQGLLQNKNSLGLFREAFILGADVMGCASNLDRGIPYRDHINAALGLAAELDIDFDIHADLGLPDQVELADLEIVFTAQRVLEMGFNRRVLAGHLCALDSAPPEVAARAIESIKNAGIHVVSQPDMYRLGREDRWHVRRGLTRVRELLAAGVNVAFASNNVRDALRPMGNFDLLEEALILAYGAHMDTVDELETLLKMSTYNAARALSLEAYGLAVGCRADLVVLDVSTPSAAIVDQAEKSYVFKSGRLVARNQRTTELL